ncbi:putative RDD family membrane protein YckC [Cryobacterium sp. MP_M5]|uniref:RDD family protein n=1 Tax=unclassified Cryobacterium TaxID=2649013 RepID=UPI0018CB5A1C|nr:MULTISPECIES: RDD family protein [unclassified Cryobacterium]MBG6059537.1 putative RDD family membrane protein YckC [Cryobacterium sp. MP_M3]MEC5177983.1 putative RDD family membrane protein YckC [Cryobacterium sp. MP_M5]
MAEHGNVADHGEYPLHEFELVTGEAVALDVRPASVILRAAGTIVDWLAYLLLFVVMALAVIWLVGDSIDEALARALGISGLVFSILIVPMTVETLTGGRSLGKLAIGARIVRDDGGAIQLRHAFIRALVGVMELYFTFGGLAAMTALLNSRSKRLGDLLAGTYSQHERVPADTAPVRGLPLELEEWAQTADIVRLPDRLSRRIAQFLRQASRLTPDSRMRLATGLAEEASAFVSPLPAVPAEMFLLGVAAVRRDRECAALLLERSRLERLRPALENLPHGFPNR